MKRIISILLLLALTLSFAACSGGSEGKPSDSTGPQGNTADTTTPGTTIYYEPDELPENLDFGGEKVVLLAPKDSKYEKELSVEDLSSEAVNDSIYNREKFVEERLGIELEVAYGGVDDAILKQATSGDNDYQIYTGGTVFFSKHCFNGSFADLYTLDYLDFDKPWWSKNFTDAAEMKGHLYIATGSLALSVPRFTFALYYNKALAEDYVDSIPELADLYSIVEAGDWTFDKLIGITSNIYQDLNGNTERDSEDLYGMLFNHGIAFDTIWSAFDITIFSRDTEEGWFYLDVNEDRFYAILDKVIDYGHRTVGTMIDPGDDKALQTTMAEKFASGSALFMSNKLHVAEEEILRNMQDEYGILPFPKYDDQQAGYYSFAHDQYLSFAIPAANPNPNTAAAVLEALSSYAYRDTVPAYLDLALKGKYMSDAKSREMIDLVISGFKIDSSWIYCETLGAFGSPFRGVIVEPSDNYASTYASCKRNIEKYLKVWGKYFDDMVVS